MDCCKYCNYEPSDEECIECEYNIFNKNSDFANELLNILKEEE